MRHVCGLLFCSASVLSQACGPSIASDDDSQDNTVDAAVVGSPDAAIVHVDAAPPNAPERAVYAHSNRQLYKVDPDSLEIELIGNIVFSDGINQLTDLAVDFDGELIGISFREVYSIDPNTAHATLLSSLVDPFNGLSFVRNGNQETLVASSQVGDLYEIAPDTGVATLFGSFGDGLTSSGDLVSVDGLGTLATVSREDWTTDRLASIDPTTGDATIIGDTGIAGLWGLGFWDNRLFGFAESGEFVTISVATGEATVVETTGVAWWGAAVTTSAPVVL